VPDFVIARAYRGQPLKRVAIKAENGLIYLANPARLDAVKEGQSFPVGFPAEDVFAFNAEVFCALEQAYKDGQSNRAQWAILSRFQMKEAAN
jgi:hypothetical protein